MEKKGQVTIFVIIAIIIVVSGIIVYLFLEKGPTTKKSMSENPNKFIDDCLEEDVANGIDLIGLQGGEIDPKFYYIYGDDGVKLTYLCYSSQYEQLCKNQKPFLRLQIENELKNHISDKVESCFQDLKKIYESNGFEVDYTPPGNFDVQLGLNSIRLDFPEVKLILKKGGEVSTYKDFSMEINKKVYRLVLIAEEIVNEESTKGEVDVDVYNFNLRNILVEKLEVNDGVRLYLMKNKETEDKFQFAVRSKVHKPGGI